MAQIVGIFPPRTMSDSEDEATLGTHEEPTGTAAEAVSSIPPSNAAEPGLEQRSSNYFGSPAQK